MRSIGMALKREHADAIAKKIGQVLRESAADVVAEELPEHLKQLLDRLRQIRADNDGGGNGSRF
jgi:hypothetical protein